MLTQKELKRQLHYAPATGVFSWKINKNGVNIGPISGRPTEHGYFRIRVNNELYLAHRLAWFYVYGYFPEHVIDHINGDPGDNRLNNLRHVTTSCNLQNCKRSKKNTSGFPGVSWLKKRRVWECYIKIHRKKIRIGYFNDPLEAALARHNFEIVDPRWTCNSRSELAKAIKSAWPEFQCA